MSKFSRKGQKPGKRNAAPRSPRRNSGAARELAVLYEDEAVIAVNKPPGLLAVPIKGSSVPSALSLVDSSQRVEGERAFIVHRIDRFASGILLFAKTQRDRNSLVKQFLAHTPEREYLAVVRGRLDPPGGTLVHYFEREGFVQELRSHKDRDATRAELRYSVEREFPAASLVRVHLATGLQNQIRAQFAAIKHPLVGDRKYHPAEASERLIDRVALHAARLQFIHPRSREKVVIESKLPFDMESLVRKLSQSKRG